MRVVTAHVGVVLVGLAFQWGCGHGTAEDRQLADLQDEVTHIQSERDRVDQRLTALEVQAADERKAAARPPASAHPIPTQHVMSVGADGSEQTQTSSEAAGAVNGDDPSDTSPRPSIRIQGAAGGGRKGARAGQATIEESVPEDSSPSSGGLSEMGGTAERSGAPAASAMDPEAHRAYEAALAQVNAHRYDPALEAFAAFLVRWPDHPMADNAMYWRGECYFAKGDFTRAAQEFEGTVSRFPYGNKAPDALLKLGMSQQKLGNGAAAKASFDRLVHDFPRSEAARRVPGGERAASHGSGPAENP